MVVNLNSVIFNDLSHRASSYNSVTGDAMIELCMGSGMSCYVGACCRSQRALSDDEFHY